MAEFKNNPMEIGALWEHEGTHGVYMTGTIADQRVIVFRNDLATGRQPQWRVLKARLKENDPSPREPHYANVPNGDIF